MEKRRARWQKSKIEGIRLVAIFLPAFLALTAMTFLNLQKAHSFRQLARVKNQELQSLTRKNILLIRLEETFLPLQKDLPLLDRAFPNEVNLSKILDKLNFIFGKNQLRLHGVGFEEIKPAQESLYLTLKITLDFRGDYPKIAQTISDLEKDEQQFDFENLRLGKTGEEKTLEGKLRLQAYFYRGKPR